MSTFGLQFSPDYRRRFLRRKRFYFEGPNWGAMRKGAKYKIEKGMVKRPSAELSLSELRRVTSAKTKIIADGDDDDSRRSFSIKLRNPPLAPMERIGFLTYEP